MEISIREELSNTNSGPDFVLFESGENDPDRLIILPTDENLSFLYLSKLWCIDGTFEISPSLFRQLFTINVLVNGRNLPVLNAFLADKTEKIYTRLFEFIKYRVNNEPGNLFCDFEKGILNSIEKSYKRTNISVCWFHLVSNLYKHV
ncbi:Ragulator complex LAMTOR3 [Brachionus plicatilis]|uniref:Ragulator complex LAMTOR3 n=1 Tax=Brachionus plicatilis TaxID=10195 RepID=A0A3M7P3C2_BRAPC|nr:Ragulator complex LAMTOR3 [Brachionus plicatilis]